MMQNSQCGQTEKLINMSEKYLISSKLILLTDLQNWSSVKRINLRLIFQQDVKPTKYQIRTTSHQV